MLIESLESLFVIVFLLVILTQVFIPVVRGTVLFPIFRRSNALEKELAAKKQADMEKTIITEIKKGEKK